MQSSASLPQNDDLFTSPPHYDLADSPDSQNSLDLSNLTPLSSNLQLHINQLITQVRSLNTSAHNETTITLSDDSSSDVTNNS